MLTSMATISLRVSISMIERKEEGCIKKDTKTWDFILIYHGLKLSTCPYHAS